MERTELDARAMAAGLSAAGERAPAGVTIRPWREDADFGPMAEVRTAAAQADGQDVAASADQLRADAEFFQVDPATTTLLAELGGRVVGFVRLLGPQFAPDTGVLLPHGGGVISEARRMGIGGALLAGLHIIGRERLAGFAKPPGTPTWFQTYAGASSPASLALLEGLDYTAARWIFVMVRPNLDAIPNLALPDGVELRPVGDGEMALRVLQAMNEAMADHPAWVDLTEAGLRAVLTHPDLGQTDVWQVAWAGEEPVAGVLGYVDAEENTQLGRQRGATEGIWTLRPWRRRGLASALMAANLRLLRERGMTEAGLVVDTENPSGALRVYERMGFKVDSKEIVYRRPV